MTEKGLASGESIDAKGGAKSKGWVGIGRPHTCRRGSGRLVGGPAADWQPGRQAHAVDWKADLQQTGRRARAPAVDWQAGGGGSGQHQRVLKAPTALLPRCWQQRPRFAVTAAGVPTQAVWARRSRGHGCGRRHRAERVRAGGGGSGGGSGVNVGSGAWAASDCSVAAAKARVATAPLCRLAPPPLSSSGRRPGIGGLPHRGKVGGATRREGGEMTPREVGRHPGGDAECEEGQAEGIRQPPLMPGRRRGG